MTARKPCVGILETGRIPENLAKKFGSYPEMIAKWLSPLDAEFKSYAVLDGELPESPEECDVWVISGSRHAAYEDHPWIEPLEAFIRACREAGRKMIGICFGHQIIAKALGGKVAKSGKGWGLGIHHYRPVDWPEALGPAPADIALEAYHQDQVERLPEGARRIAASDFCENAAIWYPGFAVTVQGHPEFSRRFAEALLENRRGTVLSDEQVDAALITQTDKPTERQLATIIRDSLQRL